ncbi:hypothetical protein [Achromobacter sp. NFACC18-2]|nr:hypothetical protein [Achromobacter sp. NFACC18-2]
MTTIPRVGQQLESLAKSEGLEPPKNPPMYTAKLKALGLRG